MLTETRRGSHRTGLRAVSQFAVRGELANRERPLPFTTSGRTASAKRCYIRTETPPDVAPAIARSRAFQDLVDADSSHPSTLVRSSHAGCITLDIHNVQACARSDCFHVGSRLSGSRFDAVFCAVSTASHRIGPAFLDGRMRRVVRFVAACRSAPRRRPHLRSQKAQNRERQGIRFRARLDLRLPPVAVGRASARFQP